MTVDQKQKPNEGLFESIGEFEFHKDEISEVTIANEGTDGFVVIDAVQWLAK